MAGVMAAFSLQTVTEALKELLLPAEVTVVSQASREDVLLQNLSRNLCAFREKLLHDTDRLALGELRTCVLTQLAWPLSSDDIVWSFVAELLLLLLCLKQAMIDALAQFTPPKPNPKSPECAPPLSPDALSISQQKTVQTALQFVVTLGICPYLLPGVGIPLGCRSEFAATVEKLVRDSVPADGSRRLYTITQLLLTIAEHPSLETLVFSRHLGDLIASLCQLGYSPNKGRHKSMLEKGSPGHCASQKGLTQAEQQGCKDALQRILDRVYQPSVIKELLILQGGSKQVVRVRGGTTQTVPQTPAWLRRLCGQFLSQALMKPHGVQAVVRGIIEGAGAGVAGGQGAEAAAADWRKCDTVARILASCPQQCLSVEDYYKQVCPQHLQNLLSRSDLLALDPVSLCLLNQSTVEDFVKCLTKAQVLELLHIKATLTARQFQRVATTTLLSMVKEQPHLADRHLLGPLLAPLITCLQTGGMAYESMPVEEVKVDEQELTRCIEDVYKVCVVGNDPLPRLMESLQTVIPAVFNLYCFTKQGVSHLRSTCQEILQWFFGKSETQVALLTLKQLAGLSPSIPVLQPLYQFSAGSEGGVKLVRKGTVSNEDDALYGKVCWDQWRAESLADLLSSLRESSIAGDFFIDCLKGLVNAAGEADGRLVPGHTNDSSDLECQQQLLIMVQLVAVMCERIGHSVLHNTVQVIEFITATLERSCVSLIHRAEETVEAQTLSMGMGLIAAILGGAVQLTSSDFVAMRPMLPLLEQLSALHPDPVIQELASDLRVTIATHGAFSSEMVSKAARSTMGSKTESTCGMQTAEDSAVTKSRDRNCASNDFQQVLEAAFDTEVSARAAALRTLTQMVQQHHSEALSNQEKVLTDIGIANDPGVSCPFLAALNKVLVNCLLTCWALREMGFEIRTSHDEVFLENLSHEDSFVYLSVIQGVSVLSDVYPAQILPRLLREYQVSPDESETLRSVETRMKIGEVLMRCTRALGEMASHYRDQLIHVFLMGSRDPDSSLRASSLSNLGELCACLDFALGSVIHEVSTCLSAVIKTEREAEVRRAAIHVITLLLRGLCDKALQVLGDVLRDLYRLLKFSVQRDVDEVVRLHAQLALEELDLVVRRALFPEEKLEKEITVLP